MKARPIVLAAVALLSIFSVLGRLAFSSGPADDDAKKEEKKSGITALPVLFYTPDTRWALGVGGLVYFPLTKDPSVGRPSSISFITYYSQNKQFSFELNPDLYLSHGYHIQFDLIYSDFPDKFYGIGNRTTADNEELFTSSYWKLSVESLKKVSAALNLGFQYFLDVTKMVKTEAGGRLASGDIPGSRGGTVSGFGYLMTYDTRDNIFYSTAGSFHQFSVMAFGRALGSDFTFSRVYLDLRRFLNITRSQTLALQSLFLLQTGDPPFWRMGLLGGDKSMRGYYLGRYRDKNMVCIQAEYRWVPVWRRVGLVGFVGLGDVTDKPSHFRLADFKYSYGCGLRFVLDKTQRLNVRIDFGFGKRTSGVYFTGGEAF
jgi:outer membrane protein assembly factor BamA